jgi:dTDP-4-amino-4,6-dideoxygalactose transaminase
MRESAATCGRILDIAKRHNLMVIEDAAQGVNASHRGRALGSIGHLGTYSCHETKKLHLRRRGGVVHQ